MANEKMVIETAMLTLLEKMMVLSWIDLHEYQFQKLVV